MQIRRCPIHTFTHDMSHNNLVTLATVCGISDHNSVPGRVDVGFAFSSVHLILGNIFPRETYTALDIFLTVHHELNI